MEFWQTVSQGILSLFLHPNCALCDRPTDREVLCPACTQALQRLQRKNPAQEWHGSLPKLIWGQYQGQLKQAIARLKYENHPELAHPLGEWLGETWNQLNLGKNPSPIVIPIPLHPDKLKQRGFNQAEKIAQSFCHTTGLSLFPHGLIRQRHTAAQFGKTASERHTNVKNAFTVNPEFLSRSPNSPILLLDDIYTTGATTQAAAETLRDRGRSVYGVVAIATTQKN